MANLPQESHGNDNRKELLFKLYQDVSLNIRVSDDISFKLIHLVPLLSTSGATILSLLKVSRSTPGWAVIAISVTAALLTFGFFVWERRYIQRCNWYVTRAAHIEEVLFNSNAGEDEELVGQYVGWEQEKKPPWSLGKIPSMKAHHGGAGKSEAEPLIYWVSMLAWLIPIVVALTCKSQ